MRQKQQRKSLRARVADRKAGVKPVVDPKREKIIGRVKLFAQLCQGVGLVMLLILLGQYVGSDYGVLSWINVAVYSGLFLLGRALLAFINLSHIMR